MSGAGWVKNLAVLLAAIVIPIAALEAVLDIRGSAPSSMFDTDSVLFYKPVPGGRKTFTHRPANGGATIHITMDRDGFRGPPVRTDGKAFRVMVYGDSFIEGEFADDSGTFVRMLERNLSKRRDTEVLNAGVIGWGPDQEFLRVQRDLPSYKPQLVVMAIFADNDLGDLIRDKIVRLAPNGALEFRHPTLHPVIAERLSALAHPHGFQRLAIVRWVERKLGRLTVTELPAIRKHTGPGSLAAYPPWAMATARQQWEEYQSSPDTVFDLGGDIYDIDVSATPDSASAHYKIALLDGLLASIHRYFADRGTPFVLLIVPSPIDACEKYDVAIDSTKYTQYHRRRISGVVDSLATRNDIRHIDLWSPFRANDACSLYYRQGDLHWNWKGQSIASGLLADSLKAWQIAP